MVRDIWVIGHALYAVTYHSLKASACQIAGIANGTRAAVRGIGSAGETASCGDGICADAYMIDTNQIHKMHDTADKI